MSVEFRSVLVERSRRVTVASGAIAAVLVLSQASDAGLVAAVGLLAGGCFAKALRVTATAEPRLETIVVGWLAAVGGVAALSAGTLAVAIQVPWPPTPPIPFLNAAPFLALGGGLLVGFGADLTVRDTPSKLADCAAVAWRRGYAVSLLPAGVALVGFPNPPGWVFPLVVGLGALAIAPTLFGDETLGSVAPPAAAVLGGLTLVAAAYSIRNPFESLLVRTARSETGRAYLVESFELLGATTVVVGVLAIAFLVPVLFWLAIAVVGRIAPLGGLTGVGAASAGVLLASISAGLAGAHPVVVFCGVAASLLVWDFGEYTTRLGQEVGYRGKTRRTELVHGAGAVAFAVAGVVVAVGLVALVAAVPAIPQPVAVLAVVAAVVGTLLLFLAAHT